MFDLEPELHELVGDGFNPDQLPPADASGAALKKFFEDFALEELGLEPEDAHDAGGDAFARAHSEAGVAAMAKARNPWNQAAIADAALAKARTEASRPPSNTPTLREEIRATVAEIPRLNSIKSYLGRVAKGAYESTGGVLDQLRHIYTKLLRSRMLTRDEEQQVAKGFECSDAPLIGAVLNKALERCL